MNEFVSTIEIRAQAELENLSRRTRQSPSSFLSLPHLEALVSRLGAQLPVHDLYSKHQRRVCVPFVSIICFSDVRFSYLSDLVFSLLKH